MIIKRKLFSFIDEDGNQGYYLYNEATGEEKLFSVVEEEREFARGVGQAVKAATQFAQSKGQGAFNRAASQLADSGGKKLRISKYLKTSTRALRNTEDTAMSSVNDVINARGRSSYRGPLNFIGKLRTV